MTPFEHHYFILSLLALYKSFTYLLIEKSRSASKTYSENCCNQDIVMEFGLKCFAL